MRSLPCFPSCSSEPIGDYNHRLIGHSIRFHCIKYLDGGNIYSTATRTLSILYQYPDSQSSDLSLIIHAHFDDNAADHLDETVSILRLPGELQYKDVSVKGVQDIHSGESSNRRIRRWGTHTLSLALPDLPNERQVWVMEPSPVSFAMLLQKR